jgi:sRNA-binding protein
VTPSILHKRLQAPHHRKKLASLKEVVARQKVEKQKKKTHTAKPKASNPVAAAALVWE